MKRFQVKKEHMKVFKSLIILFTTILLMTQCSDEESIIQNVIDNNTPPTALSPNIVGIPVVGEILKGNYTYYDQEGDQEGQSQYKWYRADTHSGLNKTEIPNAFDTLYAITDADVSKFLSFEITPVQIDSQKGQTVSSNYIGEVNNSGTLSSSLITTYRVENGILKDPYNLNVIGELLQAQQDTHKHHEIWDLVRKTIPDSYINRITKFEIFWGNTDHLNALGYVSPNSDLTVWTLGMAIDYSYPNGIFNQNNIALDTALHEFAHILTLNETQIDKQVIIGNCDNYFPDYPKKGFPRYGCSFTGSYINQYFIPFWKDLWNAGQINDIMNSNSWYFSEKYPEQFITGYAGTTPSEDLAEVYIAYILNQNSLKPIVQQKIDFFKTLPEFEQIKIETRNKLGSLASGRVNSKTRTNRMLKSAASSHQGCIRIH